MFRGMEWKTEETRNNIFIRFLCVSILLKNESAIVDEEQESSESSSCSVDEAKETKKAISSVRR